eukprot:Blabericola_migrator_1__801@NODE_119_length_13646_cov_70_025112_g107_i0_p1_GENE_NODE_119_length_13646_cov_70_025112_g107_i0NODE_119_length_13646_cov_70_025112_g107_i0_p1_ORF_typecomplete_len939_score242_69COG4/PF08318_12/5_8e02COG4/PF08318_12/2_6e13COG4/PF08318_12/3e03Rad60SLD_2/PF13881_6/0_81Rad60SLD_2/PF13881_6/1_9e03Sds3/PF08598_11/0_49Flg_hook/PF02120_16/4_6e02Flg_hook/PF02120_16/3_2Flg_hook/PF02120_16/1_4e03_NODE_119_length_13646_cov_70_025112_g107_i022005016
MRAECLELQRQAEKCLSGPGPQFQVKSLLTHIHTLDSMDHKLAAKEAEVEALIDALQPELKRLKDSVYFQQIPAYSSFIDQLQVSCSAALSQIESIYKYQLKKYEHQISIESAQEKRKAASHLASLRDDLKKRGLQVIECSTELLRRCVGDDSLCESVQSECAIQEALMTHNVVLNLGSSTWEIDTLEGRLINAGKLMDDSIKKIKMCRTLSGDDTAVSMTIEEIEDTEIESLVLNHLELDDIGFTHRLTQAKNLIKVILKKNIEDVLTWNHHITSLTVEKGQSICRLYNILSSSHIVLYFKMLYDFYTTIISHLKIEIDSSDVQVYPMSMRLLGESIADSVQALKPLLMATTSPCSPVEKLMLLRMVSSSHYDLGEKLLHNFSDRFIQRLKVASSNTSLTVPLPEWTSILLAASLLSKNVSLISSYLVNTASNFMCQSDWKEQLETLESHMGIRQGDCIDQTTGLNQTRNWDALRSSLANEAIALDVEYLRRALQQAIACDDIPLETQSIYDYTTRGFGVLLPATPNPQTKLFDTFNKRTPGRAIDGPSAYKDEVLTASNGQPSTLVDDAFFIMDGTLARVMEAEDVLGLCAILNHSVHLMSTDLLPVLSRNVSEASVLYVQVLREVVSTSESMEGDTPSSHMVPPPRFTLKHIVQKLPQEKITKGRITSAESLPHALENFVCLHKNIPRVIHTVKSKVMDVEAEADQRLKILKSSFDQFLEFQITIDKAYNTAINKASFTIYESFISPIIQRLSKIQTWDISHEDFSSQRESVSQVFLKAMEQWEIEWNNTLSPGVVQHIYVSLSTYVCDALLNFVTSLRHSLRAVSGEPRLVSAMGALEIDRNFRAIMGWFIERSEASLRSKHAKIFEICEVLSAQSLTELWDFFEASTTRIWKLDYSTLEDLLKLRYDLEGNDPTHLNAFLTSAKHGVLFSDSH